MGWGGETGEKRGICLCQSLDEEGRRTSKSRKPSDPVADRPAADAWSESSATTHHGARRTAALRTRIPLNARQKFSGMTAQYRIGSVPLSTAVATHRSPAAPPADVPSPIPRSGVKTPACSSHAKFATVTSSRATVTTA